MKQAQGFTLLELVIAISLFTVAMISILQIFPMNRRYLTQSSQTTQASFLAQEEIEDIRVLDYASVTTGTYEARHHLGTGTTDPFYQYERQTTVSLIGTTWAASGSDVGLKKVSTTIYWQERGISRQYSLFTFVYDK